MQTQADFLQMGLGLPRRGLVVLLLLCLGRLELDCCGQPSASSPADMTPSPAWSLRAWQSDEGLPDNGVVGIGQTLDGFLWVATQGGLVRFDGVEFHEFPALTSVGAPSGLMRALCVDHHNRLWVAKDLTVLACMEGGRTTAFTPRDGLPVGRAKCIVADAEDNLWVGYNGREVARVRNGKIHRFTEADGLPGGADCLLATDLAGQLWYASEGKLGIFRNERFIALTNLGSIQGICGARSGGIWVCSGTRVFRYVEGAKFQPIADIPTTPRALAAVLLYEDRSGALWAGTSDAGLFRFDGSAFQTVNTAHREILCLMEGREETLWAGTMGAGLNRLRPSIVELQDVNAAAPGEGVRSICQAADGTLWAVDRSGGVERNSGEGWRLLLPNSGWSITNAACVAAEPAGGVWIGTVRNGLHLWHDRLILSLSEAEGLAGRVIRSLQATPSGDLWIATTVETLQRWRAGKLESFALPHGCGAVRAFELDSSGTLWAGTASGLLLRIREDVLSTERLGPSGLPEAVRCLRSTPDGSLWIGYGGGGLGRLKAGKFTKFRTSDGLADDYISMVLEDERGRLWLAGNRGIFYVRQEQFDAATTNRAEQLRCVAFGREEGLPALETSWDFWPGGVRTTDGRLCIATRTGLAVINAEKLERDLAPPRVLLERISVDGREVAAYDANLAPEHDSPAQVSLRDPLARLRLGPEHEQVSFNFTAPGCASPHSVGFKYQLEGLDKDWVDAGTRRVAYYTHIPPGDYRFHVIACNRDGVWNENGASLALVAEPHFWETIWFRGAVAALACGLLAGGVVFITRRRYHEQLERLERQRLLERERSRIAQDLHDDLGAGLAEISFSSALSQDPRLSAEEAREHASEIAARAREMVTSLDEIVWAVNPTHDTLSSLTSYFCQFAQHFLKSGGIRCHLDVPRELPEAHLNAEQRHSLFMAFKEALLNAVKHSGATELRLAIRAEAKSLVISVSDNGRGFEPPGVSGQNSGDGLNNMRTRLQQLEGRCELKSQPGQGTTVIFTVPLALPQANGVRNSFTVL
jgi:signal transduction histidine kinase/ligand-binding sensor domain-containing protein